MIHQRITVFTASLFGGLFDDRTAGGAASRASTLSLSPRIAGGSRPRRLPRTDPHSGRLHPGGPRRPRRHRPGPDRHGKTAAFLLPFCNDWRDDDRPGPQAIVLAPTRELVVQVAEEAAKLSPSPQLPHRGHLRRPALPRSSSPQLRRGLAIVVGTPGRVLDHLSRGTLSLAERPLRRPRRGRPHARHRLPARHREDPAPLPDQRARRCCCRPRCRRRCCGWPSAT